MQTMASNTPGAWFAEPAGLGGIDVHGRGDIARAGLQHPSSDAGSGPRVRVAREPVQFRASLGEGHDVLAGAAGYLQNPACVREDSLQNIENGPAVPFRRRCGLFRVTPHQQRYVLEMRVLNRLFIQRVTSILGRRHPAIGGPDSKEPPKLSPCFGPQQEVSFRPRGRSGRRRPSIRSFSWLIASRMNFRNVRTRAVFTNDPMRTRSGAWLYDRI